MVEAGHEGRAEVISRQNLRTVKYKAIHLHYIIIFNIEFSLNYPRNRRPSYNQWVAA